MYLIYKYTYTDIQPHLLPLARLRDHKRLETASLNITLLPHTPGFTQLRGQKPQANPKKMRCFREHFHCGFLKELPGFATATGRGSVLPNQKPGGKKMVFYLVLSFL